MEISLYSLVLFLAILFTGLMGGLFFAWSISVIPGTKKITHASYLEVMQHINRRILNPVFYLILFGSMILLPLATYLQFRIGVDTRFWLILTAMLLYMIGTIGVTIFGNVPLNNGLDRMDLASLTPEQQASTRLNYERKWNVLHFIRMMASTGAFVLLLWGYLDLMSG